MQRTAWPGRSVLRAQAGYLKGVGSSTRARTWDLRINSPSLYQLSYRGIKELERQFSYVLELRPLFGILQRFARDLRQP